MLYRITVISWAGHGEDQILRRILIDRPPGTYIDIGAAHPKYGSVTFMLYQMGWHGIVIEPRPEFTRAWRKLRPRDLHIEAALTLEGLDGFMTNQGYRSHFLERFEGNKGVTVSKTKALSTAKFSLLAREKLSVKPTFIKIDIEGNEFQVVKSLLENDSRPEIWLIEVIDQFQSEHIRRDSSRLIRQLMETYNYKHLLFDGVNEWYVIDTSATIDRNIWAPAYPGVENFIPFHLTTNYRVKDFINRKQKRFLAKLTKALQRIMKRDE